MIKNVNTSPGVNKKLLPKYRGSYEVKAKLDHDRYVIKDIERFEVTQIPFEGMYIYSTHH